MQEGQNKLLKEYSLWKHKVVLKSITIFSLVFFNFYCLPHLLHLYRLRLFTTSVHYLKIEWLMEYLHERTGILDFDSTIWNPTMANLGANLLSPSPHCICVPFGIDVGGADKSTRKHCGAFVNKHNIVVTHLVFNIFFIKLYCLFCNWS